MNHKILQYIAIFLTISAIAGGYFYFQSTAAQKINSSQTPKLTDGLVGYWTFDGADMNATTATDKSPVGSSSGTLVGASGSQNKPQPKIGKSGQGLNFDGTDDYVSIPAASGNPLDIDSNPVTISTWIKINTLPASAAYFISRGDAGTGNGYGMFLQSDGDLRVGGHGGGQFGLSGTTLTTGTWYHVVGITNGSSSAIYLNGSLNNTGTVNVVSDNKNLWLGASCSDSSCIAAASMDYFFNGSLDETRVYSRALSASEITELYQQGQTKINASQVNKLTDGLVGYWTMDGADTNWADISTEIKDKSASVKHGNSVNMTTASATIGKIGQGLSFNGSNNYVEIPDTGDVYDFGLGNFTLSMWVNSNQGGRMIIGKDDFNTASDNGILMYQTGGRVFTYWNGNADITPDASLGGSWNYVSVVREGTGANQLKIYYNGNLVYTNSDSRDLNNSRSLIIGSDSGLNSFFNGKLDEFRVYSRALSASEITELYQQGQTKINASQAGKLTNSLVGHWTMDGNNVNWGDISSEIKDVSGNNYHADTIVSGNSAVDNSDVRIGKSGQGIYFDQLGDYATAGDIDALDGQAQLTASAWVKINAFRPYGTIIGKAPDYSSGFSISMDADYYPNYSISSMVANGDGASGYTNSLFLSDKIGEWHLWTMVFDGTQTGNSNRLKIYFDGTQRTLDYYGTIPATTLSPNSASFMIGYNGNFSPNSAIDEVRVYSRALSASEVTELYNMGR